MKTQPTTQDTKVVNQSADFHQNSTPQKSNLGKFAVLAVAALALSLERFCCRSRYICVVTEPHDPGHCDWRTLPAGDMEILVGNGFTIPQGFTCTDSHYLTTRKSADPDRAMYNMLLKAKTTQPFTGEPETVSCTDYRQSCAHRFSRPMQHRVVTLI